MPQVALSRSEIEAERERRKAGRTLSEEAAGLSGDLRSFIRAAWHVAEPATTFHSGWHIDAIAEKLEAASRGHLRRLVINIPPRHMKSLSVSVFWPVWLWTTRPSLRFLTLAFGEDLATRDALKSRRLIQSLWFRARFGNAFSLTGDQNQKTRYENDRTGYRIATTVGGSATGEGGDIIIVDDPHKADEVHSDAKRQRVLNWHDEVVSFRFNDPSAGIEVVIMQRLHEGDLTAHLLASGNWEHLCLPAEYEPSHPFVWPDDPRTEQGELLWPEHFGPREMDFLKEEIRSSYAIAGQLQQRPSPAEGGILKRAWWRYFSAEWLEYWEGPPLRALVSSWDTALKEKTTSDFTVGTLWGIAGANRYLLRRFRERVGFPDTLAAITEQARWGQEHFAGLPQTTLIELAANGPELVAALRMQLPAVLGVKVDADKVSRAHAVSAQLEAGNVFVPGVAAGDGSYDTTLTPSWVQELIEECASFPNAVYDDQVDSLTQALLRARTLSERGAVEDNRHDRGAISAAILERTF